MTAKIELEVDKCFKCPFHEKHQIMTAYSFEHEIGIYCSKVDDKSDSWARNTHDGRVDKKLVAIDDWYVDKCSNVPDWCPFIKKTYAKLIKKISESEKWGREIRLYSGFLKNDVNPLLHEDSRTYIDNTIAYASRFLQDLAQADIKSFLFSDSDHSISRDIALMEIATMLHSISDNPKKSAEIADSKYLADSDLSYEDKYIIIDTILHWADAEANIEKFDEEKERAKVYKRIPILDTCTATKMSLYLASTLSTSKRSASKALYGVTDVEFKFVYNNKLDKGDYGENPKNATELHYTADSDFDPHIFTLHPNLIEVPRSVAKGFLGFRSFKVFVNSKEFNPHLKKSPM